LSVKSFESTSHGFLKIQIGDIWYTDVPDRAELFRLFSEKSVLSAGSIYKKRVLSTNFEKTIIHL